MRTFIVQVRADSSRTDGFTVGWIRYEAINRAHAWHQLELDLVGTGESTDDYEMAELGPGRTTPGPFAPRGGA